MKTYNNGPRKGMMYGGMPKRKPMMYGGMAKKKTPQESLRGRYDVSESATTEHDAKQHHDRA